LPCGDGSLNCNGWKDSDFVRQHRILLPRGQEIGLVGIAINAGEDTVFDYAVAEQMSVQLQVKVIVVENILRKCGHGRSQSLGDGEQ
jgi:hypothetical protein